MKKFLIAASLFLMITLAFAACEKSQSEVGTVADTMVTSPSTEAETEAVLTDAPTDAVEETIPEEPTEETTESSTVKTFTVVFRVHGIPDQPQPQIVEEGGFAYFPHVNRPEDCSVLDGWYLGSSNIGEKFDFSTPITEDIILYAYLLGPETQPPEEINQPAYYIEPEFIEFNANNDGTNYRKEMGTAEMMTEDNRSFVRLFPDPNGIGDGYVTVIDVGSHTSVANYMVISYRTNGHLDGQMYMGSGDRWNGQGDELKLDWIKDEAWHLLIVDLSSTSLTSVQNNILNYCRLDMFENKTQPHEYLDVEYIAFFDDLETAEAFDAQRREISA